MSDLKEVKAKILDVLEFMTDEMIREFSSRVDTSTYKKVEALAHSFEMLDSCDPIWEKEVQYDRPDQQTGCD